MYNVIAKDLDDLMIPVKEYIQNTDNLALIERAYHYAKDKHEGQFRKSGEPYFTHVLQVAFILAQMHVGPKTICAGLLHDVLEDTDTTREQMEAEFDDEITVLVESVTKIGNIQFKDEKEYLAANHRKIFIAMAKDIRVILIKLVDRLHNMRTLQYKSPESQKKIASETLEVYAPIAHRLGLSEIKNELEDICFQYLHRDEYYHIAKLVENKKAERDAQINSLIEEISNILTEHNIKFRIFGRSKHLYSIYKKMNQKNKRFEEILDLLAIRIVTESELNCYEILGYIHATYRPIPGRLKDYIAMPKMNMYQSLHTTIVSPSGKIFEVQIRTEQMDAIAELGVAAHWAYKEGRKYDPNKEQKEIEQKLSWFKDMISVSDDLHEDDAAGFMDVLITDVFDANVFVMTPKGRVIDLPAGSTPIDFAYRVHTEVGHSAVGAIVNESLVPLNTELKTGDVVQIRTSKHFPGPSEDWLKFVKTQNAKNKIRSYLLKKETERREEFVNKGESMLKEELKKRGFDEKEYYDRKKLDSISHSFQVSSHNDLLYALAVKSVSLIDVIEKLTNQKKSISLSPEDITKIYNKDSNKRLVSKTGIKVVGVDSMLIGLAACCSPIYGDDIVGYITKGQGVKVHRKTCPNIINENKRLISVEWDENHEKTKYEANLQVYSVDRNFLLTDLVTCISQYKASMQNINASVNNDDLTALIKITVLVDDADHLRTLIANLRKVDSVIEVERVFQ